MPFSDNTEVKHPTAISVRFKVPDALGELRA